MVRRVKRALEQSWYSPDVMCELDDGSTKKNRELPNGDRFEVLLHPMSGAEVLSAQQQMGKITKHGINLTERSQAVRRSVICKRVLDVRGAEYEDKHGGWFAPKNGHQLCNAVEGAAGNEPGELYDDIYVALQDMSVLREGLLGESESRSASSPATIAQSEGGAANGAGEKSAQAQISTIPPSGGRGIAMD